MGSTEDYRLDKERHIKYWKRCAQVLPEPYTPGDSSRMSFGFFIVAALDLLGALDTAVTAAEKQSWIEWIYACQVAHTGGFRGFTGTMLGGQRSYHNWHWDVANLPNTYFALATLVLLGDDLARVKRRECLDWVKSLQRPNGSFGEFSGEDDEVEGADDPRHCMCAVGIINILQGNEVNDGKHSIDEQGLRRYIANCQVRHLEDSADIASANDYLSLPRVESAKLLCSSHIVCDSPPTKPASFNVLTAGLNYCGIATLSFLSLLQSPVLSIEDMAHRAEVDLPSCTRWMLDRQTTWIEEDEDDDDDDDDLDEKPTENQAEKSHSYAFHLSALQDGIESHELVAGFCGRCGKIADTCYCFWNVGALAVSTHQRDAVKPD